MHAICPHCGKESAEESPRFCSNCGARMDGSVPPGFPGAPAPAKELKNTQVAGFCSSVLPGLGQVYNGETVKGFVLFLLAIAGFCLFLLPGFLVWFYSLYDAYAVAGKMNSGEMEFQKTHTLHLVLFIVFAILVIAFVLVFIITLLITSLTPRLGIIGTGNYDWMFNKSFTLT